VPVASSTHSIELFTGPAELWAFVSDMSLTPRWRTTVESVDAPATLEIGTRMPATTRMFGKRWQWTIEITAIEPPTRLAYRTTGMTTIDVEYVVSPTPNGGSRFAFTGASPSKLAVLARHSLDREARTALSNLRTLLDAPQRPSAP
jgi:hypothetical protein